jgi:acetyl esterase
VSVIRGCVVLVLAGLTGVMAAPVTGASAPVDVRHDVQYGVANGKALLLDAYVPADGRSRRPAVVMIHGGGWRAGDKASWAEEANRFAERGWVAFSVNYRLDEPSAFPAEVDDVQSAVRWVRSHAGEYGVETSRVAAVGESAGGHLTAMLATLGQGPLDDDARIRVGAAWSPPVDLTDLARSRGDQWATRVIGCSLTTCEDRLNQASPVNHVDGSDAPLYLVNSTNELVPLPQVQVMADRLAAARVDHQLDVLEGTRHALDFRQDAWAPTVAFLEKHLAASKTDSSSSASSSVVIAITAGVVGLMVAASAVVLRRRRTT